MQSQRSYKKIKKGGRKKLVVINKNGPIIALMLISKNFICNKNAL